MSKGFYSIPYPKNEPVLSYAPGSKERAALKKALAEARSTTLDIPMYIGAEEVRTGKKKAIAPPHDHQNILGHFHEGDKGHVEQAINAALGAKELWANLDWEQRASIFLKAADLLAGPWRYRMNAATMLGQSKNAYQAEIDSACELIDFLRFNVHFMGEIYREQPESGPGVWNRLEYRPLEGFLFALTPFNFTAIGGNLPTSMAMMGNTVVWKPANTQVYSASVFMQILKEAGLPDGVINLVYVSGPNAGEVIFNHKDFAGIQFTGSTGVFQGMWKTIGENIARYKSYPRIVGETGGKDFIVAHKTANAREVSTAIARGAFEYQGQKCSAASRAYIPSNLWEDVKKYLVEDLKSFKMGGPEDFGNFINAVIDEKGFNSITSYIEQARKNPMNEIIAGGKYDKSKGYFIEPTVILTKDPSSVTMCEEIFGPVITIYVYHQENFEQTLELVDKTSPYALTGSILAKDRYAIEMATRKLVNSAGNFYINDKPTGAVVGQQPFGGARGSCTNDKTSPYALTGSILAKDRYAIEMATRKLVNSAGNFYINDKPTGAVVGQQPFGGARGSGTNDKAGAKVNLMRWVSMRTIKETFVTPVDYRYPFLDKE